MGSDQSPNQKRAAKTRQKGNSLVRGLMGYFSQPSSTTETLPLEFNEFYNMDENSPGIGVVDPERIKMAGKPVDSPYVLNTPEAQKYYGGILTEQRAEQTGLRKSIADEKLRREKELYDLENITPRQMDLETRKKVALDKGLIANPAGMPLIEAQAERNNAFNIQKNAADIQKSIADDWENRNKADAARAISGDLTTQQAIHGANQKITEAIAGREKAAFDAQVYSLRNTPENLRMAVDKENTVTGQTFGRLMPDGRLAISGREEIDVPQQYNEKTGIGTDAYKKKQTFQETLNLSGNDTTQTTKKSENAKTAVVNPVELQPTEEPGVFLYRGRRVRVKQ